MDDLIKRQDAINAAVEAVDKWCGKIDPEREIAVTRAILALPTAQLGRKKGKWIHKGAYCFACDQCGDLVSINVYIVDHVYDRFKFCPNCGADMREGDDNA